MHQIVAVQRRSRAYQLDLQRQAAMGTQGHQRGAAFAHLALKGGVAKIAAWAQRGMSGIQQAIQGDMSANNGQVDPAKMQHYTMQMSNYEMMNQLAAKIQEKQDASIRAWLR